MASAHLVAGLVTSSRSGSCSRIVLDGVRWATSCSRCPEVPLTAAAGSASVAWSLSRGSSLRFYDGLRPTTMIICLGAANLLANPQRPLAVTRQRPTRSDPHHRRPVGGAATGRERPAVGLRPAGCAGEVGLPHPLFRQVAVPVMTDALTASLMLGRSHGLPVHTDAIAGDLPARRRWTAVLVLGGLVGVAIGTYGLLDSTRPGPRRT